MSPQQQVLQRHGSPQPGMMNNPGMMNTPGMRPPMMADGRFIRPTGAPGKEMRPRMPVSQVPRGHQPNFGPRAPMHMRPGNPSPVYSGPMGGSPAHQPQYGGVSPQHGGMQGPPQAQQQQMQQPQQMRPLSAGGGVTSPATDRPVTPQTPRYIKKRHQF